MSVKVTSPQKVMKCECKKCGSGLEYVYTDAKRDYSTDYTGDKSFYWVIICPACKNKVTVKNGYYFP